MAFVLRHGEVAREVLFRDVQEEGELPGVTAAERAAVERVEPHLREEWVAILSACREGLWRQVAGHPAASNLRKSRTRASTMWRHDRVEMPLLAGWKATCGVTLRPWGAATHKLYLWVWTQKGLQSIAASAVEGKIEGLWRSSSGSFFLTLEPPQEGESFNAIGERVGVALWSLARPIHELLSVQRSG